jgi:simple sugar transport system ATP-binding protein
MNQGDVEIHDITMSFASNPVLRGVDMAIPQGKVSALLGANGAGKSTLIKVLSGVYPQHGGSVQIGGEPIHLGTPADSRSAGIETVHQRIDEGIIPGLSIAENLLFEQIVSGKIRKVASLRSMLKPAREVAQALQLDWSDSFLRKDVFELGIADKQMLTLARALSRYPKLLILDEPTSALSQAEVDRLFEVIRRLRDRGVAILYVSHRLGEIESLADNLVVLRDGAILGEQQAPFDWDVALTHMLGEQAIREMADFQEKRGFELCLSMKSIKLFQRSEPFDLGVNKGEVLGVVGLLGSGKSELARGIYGADKFLDGSMELGGAAFQPSTPAAAIKKKVYLIPEDRAAESMLPGWSIARTVSLPFLNQFSSGFVLSFTAERGEGQRIIDDLGVVATGPDQDVDALSGGNQQKIVVGRWLQGNPQLLLLDEPFRGVDIGARREISRKARSVAAEGNAVMVLTSDIDEALEVADRILVLVDGEARFDSYVSQTSRAQILSKMSEVA